MNYTELNAVFLTLAGLLGILAVFRCRAGRRRAVLASAAAAVVVLVILTAVFDNLMLAAGLFGYTPETLSGHHIGLAPLEDFAYPVAAAILLPALWVLFAGKREQK
ncbi:lycopene cyclase domain-containing protein [Zhihengliuella halotolerans]|uniref:Lycopene cyclase domain-containing protein n=1 Tax=Zhihengliuella halotolerans TaxID=370736 RepID=A0A4Q8AFG4_9MICC|nr:lycopene cyclase domain-containing protein [Zhihengliuella halotolerans]RZU62998.1 lycopene cyclase domain-containing protein [Zhihengliuella halotolerans]